MTLATYTDDTAITVIVETPAAKLLSWARLVVSVAVVVVVVVVVVAGTVNEKRSLPTTNPSGNCCASAVASVRTKLAPQDPLAGSTNSIFIEILPEAGVDSK